MTGTDLEILDGGEIEEVEPSPEEEAAALAIQAQEIGEELASKVADLNVLAGEVAALTRTDESTALVSRDETPVAARKRLAGQRAKVERKRQDFERVQEEVGSLQKQQLEVMREQQEAMVRRANEALAPIQKFVAQLEEGIWMVNLYLGRREQIVRLYEGDAAPAKMITSIRQMVLAMDEESAVNPEDDGIDAADIDLFDEWLRADWAHVMQVLPEEKGVVALRPRWDAKVYEGDVWKTEALAKANEKAYFLIRNGRNVYRTCTEFDIGDRLVPHADEFTSYFYEAPSGWLPDGVDLSHKRGKKKHRIPILPGTPAWDRAEEQADARKRHYMRVGLILQGLADRTTVFHPMPEGGINFLDFDHNGKSWRFVLDAEMSLGTGRKPYRDWIKDLNAQLEPGMRIVGEFSHRHFNDGDDGSNSYGYRGRIGRVHPRRAEWPKTGVLHTIKERITDGDYEGGFLITYPRTREEYFPREFQADPNHPRGWGHYGVSRVPKTPASCALMASDSFIIPFDLVTEAELIEYLNARLERHAYSDMFPLLKAAIHAKRAEAEEEAPFRTMLAGVLARDNGVTVAEAEEALEDLIRWWKLANKNHRPLVGDEKSQAKAVKLIVAEHARRIEAQRKGASSEIVQAILAQHPSAILVARKRTGRYTALVPANNDNVFVHEIEFTTKSGQEITRGEWRLMPPLNRREKWLVVHKTERFDSWDFAAKLSEHLTEPEIERLSAQAVADKPDGTIAVAWHAGRQKWHVWSFLGGLNTPEGFEDEDEDIDPKSLVREREPARHAEARGWQRVGGEAKLKPWGSDNHVQRGIPWDTRGPADYFNPEPVTVNAYTVLHLDQKREDAFQRVRVEWAERDARRDRLGREIAGLMGSISKAWEARREEELLREFVEEYLDPELWEGHRKGMSDRERAAFEYPYRQRGHYKARAGHGEEKPDAFLSLIQYAVLSGIDLDGLMVREALDAHYPPVEWFGEPRTRYVKRYENGGASYYDEPHEGAEPVTERLPEPGDVPEDLLDLRFKYTRPGADNDGDTDQEDDDDDE